MNGGHSPPYKGFLMSRYRRTDLPGATYFFTVVTYRRRPILWNERVRVALRNAIKTVQSPYPFTIDAFVLLPDHLHCIWTLPPGDAAYPMRWGTNQTAGFKKLCGLSSSGRLANVF
jgi:REP element-mobilizing transposase RayT